MFGETLQLRFKFHNHFHCGPNINIIIVGLWGSLESTQYGTTIRIRTVYDDNLKDKKRNDWKWKFTSTGPKGIVPVFFLAWEKKEPPPPPSYLCITEMIQHLQPDISLMVIRWHGAQKGNMNVFVREGCITGWDTNHGYLKESTGVTDSCRW